MKQVLLLLAILGGFFGLGLWFLTGGPGSKTVSAAIRDLMASGKLTQWVVWLAVAVTVGAVGFGWWRAQRVDTVWPQFARKHGLIYEPRSAEHPLGTVTGTIGGRAFELGLHSRWNFDRTERITRTRMRVRILSAPAGMSIVRNVEMPLGETIPTPDVSTLRRITGTIAEQETTRRENRDEREERADREDGEDGRPYHRVRITVGDHSFDDAVDVRGDDEDATANWLDEHRRRNAIELVSEDGYFVSEGFAVWQDRFAPTTLEDLETILYRLRDFSHRLDSD